MKKTFLSIFLFFLLISCGSFVNPLIQIENDESYVNGYVFSNFKLGTAREEIEYTEFYLRNYKDINRYSIIYLYIYDNAGKQIDTSKTTQTITHSKKFIKMPYKSQNTKVYFRINMKIEDDTGKISNVFDFNLNRVTSMYYLDSLDQNIFSLPDTHIGIINKEFILLGDCFDFSHINFNIVRNLRYGKLPFKYFKFLYKNILNGDYIEFPMETESNLCLGFKLPDGANGYMGLEPAADAGGVWSIYYCEPLFNNETKINYIVLKKKRYLQEGPNFLSKKYDSQYFSKEVSDIYFPTTSYNLYKKTYAYIRISESYIHAPLQFTFEIDFDEKFFSEEEITYGIDSGFRNSEVSGGVDLLL